MEAVFYLDIYQTTRSYKPKYHDLNRLNPSGYYMYRQFNIQQFYVLPTQTLFMCFVWIWEQTAIISLYSISWLVCITETVCLLSGTDWMFIFNSG